MSIHDDTITFIKAGTYKVAYQVAADFYCHPKGPSTVTAQGVLNNVPVPASETKITFDNTEACPDMPNPEMEMTPTQPPQGPVTLLDPSSQPRFVNPLKNTLDPDFIYKPVKKNKYEIGIFQFQEELGLFDPNTQKSLSTTVWGYATPSQKPTYPGRTFLVKKDKAIKVMWSNHLVNAEGQNLPHLLPVDTTIHWANPQNPMYPASGVPTVTHLHGGLTPYLSDGHPEAWFTPNYQQTGRFFNKKYTYPNKQNATALWYHDHALGLTRLNVYAGLAGFYIIQDKHEKCLLKKNLLPAWPYDVPLLIQDRLFTTSGALFYPSTPTQPNQPNPSVLPFFAGNFALVNGKAWPALEVEPRQYRLRFLNGSDSRFYTLILSTGQNFVQIGADQGLLERPLEKANFVMAPGERYDMVVDFSGHFGETIVLNNTATDLPDIMAFKVTRPLNPCRPLTHVPDVLKAPLNPITGFWNGGVRQVQLASIPNKDQYGRPLILLGTIQEGGLMWEQPTTEYPKVGSYEIWEIYNTMMGTHPIHLHAVDFHLINQQAFTADQDPVTGALSNIILVGDPTTHEEGPKDTIKTPAGFVTRILVPFSLAGFYVWHCHMLSHEDHDMMRPMTIEDAVKHETVKKQFEVTVASGDNLTIVIGSSNKASHGFLKCLKAKRV